MASTSKTTYLHTSEPVISQLASARVASSPSTAPPVIEHAGQCPVVTPEPCVLVIRGSIRRANCLEQEGRNHNHAAEHEIQSDQGILCDLSRYVWQQTAPEHDAKEGTEGSASCRPTIEAPLRAWCRFPQHVELVLLPRPPSYREHQHDNRYERPPTIQAGQSAKGCGAGAMVAGRNEGTPSPSTMNCPETGDVNCLSPARSIAIRM